jgi:hypothetical protein
MLSWLANQTPRLLISPLSFFLFPYFQMYEGNEPGTALPEKTLDTSFALLTRKPSIAPQQPANTGRVRYALKVYLDLHRLVGFTITNVLIELNWITEI